jgi:type II secretory pathway pseudopilin PulG
MFKILAVVVGAILVLMVAAVLIPCLLSSKDSANESSAASMTRSLATAEIQYQSTHGQYVDMKALAGNCSPTSACAIDPTVTTSSPASPRNDYYFIAQPGPSAGTFVVAALPVKFPHKSFCAIDDGVVRSENRRSSSGATGYAGCKSMPPLAP